MGKKFGGVLAVLIVLFAVLYWRASDLPSPYLDAPAAPEPEYDTSVIAQHLSEAVKIKTISWSPTAETEGEAFLAFHDFLETTFPTVHRTLTREIVNEYSLLYRWQGRDPSKKPIAILGHMDVVPIEPGTEGDWEHPPFSGAIVDGFIWGRGVLDDKSSVVLSMEAIEALTREGFVPEQDIYLAFGHDEEIAGQRGAVKIVETLKERGITFDWILDEGFTILDGYLDYINGPMAVLGIVEKGFLTLELTATDAGGHSSTPRADTAVSKLARAVEKVQSTPFPIQIDAEDEVRIRATAAEMPFIERIMASNLWLFGHFVKAQIAENPYSAAQFRTTTAATVFNAGTKENILPQEAKALINFRIHPRDTIDSVVARTKEVIGDDSIDVQIYAVPSNPPQPSNVDGAPYAMITGALGDSFGPIAATPSLVVGATDSRFYIDIADEIFRFTPIVMTLEQFSGFHGTGERVAVENLGRSVKFYERLIRRASSTEEGGAQ